MLVQGDTSSALGGALAAQSAGVPIGHVEAGLRTHDSRNPWPEEDFRKQVDALSALLFAPTELSAANLRRERVRGTIHVTGNTAVDAVKRMMTRLPPRSLSDRDRCGLLVTCHRRESWGEGLQEIARALRDICATGRVMTDFVLHPNPEVAARFHAMLDGAQGITLHQPCVHWEMLARMQASDLILSDSGGMQEEAAVLGVPLLILRDRTERPEAIASGNIALVGRDPKCITAEVARLLDDPAALDAMRRSAMPYGDGQASELIAVIIAGALGVGKSALAAVAA